MADIEVTVDGVDDFSSENNPSDGDFFSGDMENESAGSENDSARVKAALTSDETANISVLKAEIEELRKEKLDLIRDSDGAKKRIFKLKAELEGMLVERVAMEHEIEEMRKEDAERSEEVRRTVESVTGRAGELEREVERLQKDLATAVAAEKDARREAEELRGEVEALKGEKTRLEEEVSKMMVLEREKEILNEEVKELVERSARLSERSNESVAKFDELMKKVMVTEEAVATEEGEKTSGLGGVSLPVFGAATGVVLVAVIAVAWITNSKRS
ncbi:hypothetical protein Droror1_Dr00022953 [Drosera rotundifolia]